jgi:menaquinone-dependent protoporphyrinogen IX oxidase
MTSSRVLVVFFSRTGTTRRVALDVAKGLRADIAELTEDRPRTGILGYLRSGFEATRRRTTTLRDLHPEALRYDLVVVGTPVWAASVCSPVRTFLRHHAGKLPALAFFATMGGRGSEGAFLEMTQEAKRKPIASLALTERDVQAGRHRPGVEGFVGRLRRAAVLPAA